MIVATANVSTIPNVSTISRMHGDDWARCPFSLVGAHTAHHGADEPLGLHEDFCTALECESARDRTLGPQLGAVVRRRSDFDRDAFAQANLFAPVMFHPVPHFFVGFGPFLDADLSGDDKVTSSGGRLTIGGWFDT